MGSNLMNALPWAIAFVAVLCLYLYVRSRRIRKK